MKFTMEENPQTGKWTATFEIEGACGWQIGYGAKHQLEALVEAVRDFVEGVDEDASESDTENQDSDIDEVVSIWVWQGGDDE